MITPRPFREYDGGGARFAAEILGADDADRLAIQKAAAFLELRQVDAPRLRELIAGLWSEHVSLIDAGATAGELAAWCTDALAAGRIGLALGAIREAYVHTGWAVTAATLAAEDAAAALPAWDELVAQTSRLATARFADAACEVLESLDPFADRLDAIAAPAPGRELAGAALSRIADAVALGDVRAAPARSRLAHAFASVDAVLASVPIPAAPAETAVDPTPFAGWLAIEQAGDWTWARALAWRDGDPLAPGKAIVRVAGIPIASLLDEVRIAIATQLDALAPLAWRRAIADARGELADPPASPLTGAIATLADAAFAYAARQIAEAVRDRCDPRPILDALLGDPRNCPAAWEPSAFAIREAL